MGVSETDVLYDVWGGNKKGPISDRNAILDEHPGAPGSHKVRGSELSKPFWLARST